MKIKKIFISVIFLLSTTIAIFTLISIVNQLVKENEECAEIENSIFELKKSVIKTDNKDENEKDIFKEKVEDIYMDRQFDWDEIHNINEDIVGWLYIPNTNIDYPILQEQEVDEQYYLHHDYKGDYLYAGSVFTPKQPYENIEDAHMLLFAHRMKDKTIMFSSLSSYYYDKESMLENKYVYIYRRDKVERFVVWCTKNTKYNDSVYTLPYVLGSEQYKDLLLNIETTSNHVIGDSPSENDKTLVLSTCAGKSGGSERFFVVFKIDEIKVEKVRE